MDYLLQTNLTASQLRPLGSQLGTTWKWWASTRNITFSDLNQLYPSIGHLPDTSHGIKEQKIQYGHYVEFSRS